MPTRWNWITAFLVLDAIVTVVVVWWVIKRRARNDGERDGTRDRSERL